MNLYTFVFRAYYEVRIKQIASHLSAEEVKRTYFNSLWTLASVFPLDDNIPTKENVYLWEFDIFADDMSQSI